MIHTRHSFLHTSLAAAFLPAALRAQDKKAPLFKISLAEWSFHKALFAKEMKNTDFPVRAKKEFGMATLLFNLALGPRWSWEGFDTPERKQFESKLDCDMLRDPQKS